jgi:Zn finger protein HypA/HybF involved in hydrogenase expression
MIAFHCPKCRTSLRRQDQEAGSKIPCPSCGQRLQVPQPPPSDHTVMGELSLDAANQTLLGDLAPQPSPRNFPQPRPVLPAPVRTPTASFQFACPYCQTVITANANNVGKRVACPRCKSPMDILLPGGPLANVPLPVAAFAEQRLAVIEIEDEPPIEVHPAPVAPSDLFALDVSKTPLAKKRKSERRPSLGRIGCFLGLLVLGLCGGLGAIAFFSQTPASNRLSEPEAKERLKKVLDAWVNGKDRQTLARQYPKIEFADQYHTDGVALLRFDIERVELNEYLNECRITTRLVTPATDGGECRFERVYEVKRPDEKGVWRIQVSSFSPSGPPAIDAPTQSTARDQLVAVLDAWVARQWKEELKKKYPRIELVDLDYSDTELITRYDVGRASGPTDAGTWRFQVALVFLRKDNRESRVIKNFDVEKPDDRGIWRVRGYRS